MKCWYLIDTICNRPPGICEGCERYEDWRKEREKMTEGEFAPFIEGLIRAEEHDRKLLKPCPFCGSVEIHTYEPTMYEMGNDASVNCENPICEAEVRGRTLKEAISKWNRRVNE